MAGTGKLIVVTGNRRGLGAALTTELLSRGHRVVGCSSGALAPNRVDVSRFDEVEAWAQQLLSREGVPDVVVNNAATVTERKPLWQQTPAQFQHLLMVNVAGVHNVIRALLPRMIERGSGVVVNFSSGYGRTVAPQMAPYCASKWAIEGLTGALSAELPPGLAAVTLDPGTINTEMLQSAIGAAARYFPSPEPWSKNAADLILQLDASHNGKALTVPKPT